MVVLVACSRLPGPADPSTGSLFHDLERQVTVAAATGWNIDRLEIENLVDPALDSVCRVEPLARQSLLAWLDARIAEEGGPVEAAWRRKGKRLSAVDDLLVLTRIRMLLKRADELAPADCPFWRTPEEPFRGRQISDGKWQVTFGGGGKGVVTRRDGQNDLRFGGAGRLLIGRVFDVHGVYAGFEAGAVAEFPRDATGERSSLVIGADFVAPVVYRRTATNAYIELEAGYLGHSDERDWGDFQHGIHVGASIGGRALRQRILFPGFAFGVSIERLFLPGADLTALKLGARVAFDLDLW